MGLSAGQVLSSYEVIAPLGAGAMGEVYRARDTRLGREVALKVLPEHFADDEERLRRFEREAKTLASLNHPNVAQIHGVDQVGDTCFLVLELVPGETLEERLRRGRLPLDEALDVCRQIAEGLEAAHEAGVIHRDLKPANVRLTPEGKVKVLDFGLAKPMHDAHEARSSTDSVLSTEAGRLLGTPTYMAPEQARGKPIDKRVDVWAFGCVLYECLAGRRAFEGETLSDVLGSVLRAEPDLEGLPGPVPRSVRELVRRCFVKDPRSRLRDLGEARLVLERALSPSAEEEVGAPQPRSQQRTLLLALLWAGSLAAVALATWLAFRARPASMEPVTRAHIVLPGDLRLTVIDGCLALSPDGRTLAFIAQRGEERPLIWIRPLESLVAQPLSGTEGAVYPFWSPDGRSLAFFADAKLKRIPAAGGSVSTLCDAAEPRGGTWTSRDEIVFAPAPFGPLQRVPAGGGSPQPVTQAEGRSSHRVPNALPDGRRVLFGQSNSERDGILLVDLDTGATRHVSDDPSDARFVVPGALLFYRGGNLVEQPFDLSAGALAGEPRLVAERVVFDAHRLTGRYTASAGGAIVYQPVSDARLEWFDLEGKSLGRIGASGPYVAASVSPDGRRVVALLTRGDAAWDTWILDAQTGLGAPQKSLEGVVGIAWSPDSRSIACARITGGRFELSVHDLDGSSPGRILGSGAPFDWSRDGAWISVMRQEPDTKLDVYAVRADGSAEPVAVATTDASELGGAFSPDGRWILYISDQGGRSELFVAPLGRPGGGRPITSIGIQGAWPAWTDDGRILFQTISGELCELPVTEREGELELGELRLAFGGREVPTARGVSVTGGVSIARDGRRLLAIVSESGAGEPPLVLVERRPAAEGR